MREPYKMLIGGKFVTANSGNLINSINPATEQVLHQIQRGNATDVDRAVEAANSCFYSHEWQSLTYNDRADILREIADLIMENAVHLAKLECEENGKPIKESSLIDIPEAAETFRAFASMALQMKGETFPSNGSTFSYTFYEPLGVVAAVIPWNYPLLMAAWKLAPALAAGNTIVIKPSEMTSATLLELGELLSQTALPAGAVNIVTGTGAEVGEPLVAHPKVNKVAFTGSTITGSAILSQTAKNIVPASMELGGKSATILCKDTDLDVSINGILTTIFMNQGQMCVAGSRLLIDRAIYDEVLNRMKAKLAKMKIGAGDSPLTDMGPLISADHRRKVTNMIDEACSAGAVQVFGAADCAMPDTGWFCAPTILAKVKMDMEIWHREVFGPVLIVQPFDTIDEAINLANNSDYGLAVSVWSTDHYTISRCCREIRVGRIWINTYGDFSNEVPFGGTKKSGFGRELGLDGLLTFCNKKSVTMDISSDKTPIVARWYGM